MEFFRNWTSEIVGVIVFYALCEIITPENDTKKYIKIILGMIVTVTLIKPIENINFNDVKDTFLSYDKVLAYNQQENYNDMEKDKILKLYCKKIEDKIVKHLEEKFKIRVSASVKVHTEKPERFGEISEIYLVIYQKNVFKDYSDEIRNELKKVFGIEDNKVKLKFISE